MEIPEDERVVKIGVKFKKQDPDDKMLSLVPRYTGCINHSYIIDAEAKEVTCSKCTKTFDPMSVLVDLARHESRWFEHKRQYVQEMKRLDEKSRTKCQHCGKMTRLK